MHSQDTWEPPRRRYDDEDEEVDDDETEDEVDRDAEEDGGDAADNTWDKDTEEGNEVSPEDGLQDLQYFPNFYRLLRSLNSGKTRFRSAPQKMITSQYPPSKDRSSSDQELGLDGCGCHGDIVLKDESVLVLYALVYPDTSSQEVQMKHTHTHN